MRGVRDQWVRLRDDLMPQLWPRTDAAAGLCLPEVSSRAVRGLKFGEALPPRLAEATLAARLTDEKSDGTVLAEPARFLRLGYE
ncbi:hypothetical protein AB0H45_12285 [Streptomyces atroolivaceus]|uniref:hypothetical protein n=1 Tax=Streptomyces atroolivaceus TaxID=66869 RepID=UPI0005254838